MQWNIAAITGATRGTSTTKLYRKLGFGKLNLFLLYFSVSIDHLHIFTLLLLCNLQAISRKKMLRVSFCWKFGQLPLKIRIFVNVICIVSPHC